MALALYFDLVEDPDKEVVLQNLLAAIREKGGHIDAGVVGTKAVINALLMYGEDRVLYEMTDKRDFPGWGYWVEQFGATTMYQNWDASQSRNHIMFGSIGDYFYKGLGGINIDDRNPGFRHIIVRPSLDNDITWVEAGLETLYGPVSVHWRKEGDLLHLDLRHPPGTTLEVQVSENQSVALRVNGKTRAMDQ
jgi:alpha-L-rhamnosidase